VRRLSEAGYSAKLKQENNPTVPAGNVIRTDPAAGVTPPKGATSVTVYVSLGATTTTLGKVTVPNVINMTEQNARSTLTSAGFVVQVVYQTTSGTPDRVKAQSPGGNTKATQGSTVVITVSAAATTTTTHGSTSTSGGSTTTTSTTTIL
jgi:serine/threonine-protein kinase